MDLRSIYLEKDGTCKFIPQNNTELLGMIVETMRPWLYVNGLGDMEETAFRGLT